MCICCSKNLVEFNLMRSSVSQLRNCKLIVNLNPRALCIENKTFNYVAENIVRILISPTRVRNPVFFLITGKTDLSLKNSGGQNNNAKIYS